MSFPVLRIEKDGQGKERRSLWQVWYFMKDGRLHRGEQELSGRMQKPPVNERIVLDKPEEIRFSYSFLDEEEKIEYQDFWPEEPYFGIPRAVLVEAAVADGRDGFRKLIALPQGRWGHIQEEHDGGTSHD